MAEITVLYFAAASTATKRSFEQVALPYTPFPLRDLSAFLVSKYPTSNLDRVLKTSQWSIDAEMVEEPDSAMLKGGEEVAVICPVSGGLSCGLIVLNQVMAIEPRSAFIASRLTPTTFLVKEFDDVFSEHPHIYVKILPSAGTILIIDTGCGGRTKDTGVEIKSLRAFIENVKIKDNGDLPLNGGPAKFKYVVVTTHCHYDHILGVNDFPDSPILASSFSPDFLSPSKIARNSLCDALGLDMPQYKRTLVPHLHQIHAPDNPQSLLDVTILHTPGHTPDELSLYDPAEKMLYVGDTLYEAEPIIFPKEGSIVDWLDSLHYLTAFVKAHNSDRPLREVLINSGHCTSMEPALEVLEAAGRFMFDVIEGREPMQEQMDKRGEETGVFRQLDGRFSLICPLRLIEEARKHRSRLS